jgi:hypothetical protein
LISVCVKSLSNGTGVESVVRIAAKRRCSVSLNATTHCSIKIQSKTKRILINHIRFDDEPRKRFRTGKQFAGKSVRFLLTDKGPLSYFTHGNVDILQLNVIFHFLF